MAGGKENIEKQWINWLRSGSQLFAGIKITMAFLSYLSIGQIGKWLFETFYPFTRLLWSDFLEWLNLPEISILEKDALTAALFFIPLGISSIFSHFTNRELENISDQDLSSDRRTAILFASIFIFLICGGLFVNVKNSVG